MAALFMTETASATTVETRARQSLGSSADAIYRTVDAALAHRNISGGTIVDVGCGVGNLWAFVRERFDRYVGVDVLRYESFPDEAEFHRIDLDSGRADLPDESADVVAGIETIEHLENPRAYVRELVRLCKPGGWIIVTTPNQLSLLSKLTLIVFNEFNAFRASSYPAHITALLEVDLRRLAKECGLTDVAIQYTRSGRIPGTGMKYPLTMSRLFPRALSDNVLMIGRKPLA